MCLRSEWTTYPVREETLYCAFASKFAAPFVCPWELPGCSEPRYPEGHLSARSLAFGAWGKLVQLSYFHFAQTVAVGVLINALMLYLLCRCCCARGKRQAQGVML